MVTMQEARKIARAHMREFAGQDWWKGDESLVRARKLAVRKATKLILAQQDAQTPQVSPKEDTPVLPTPEALAGLPEAVVVTPPAPPQAPEAGTLEADRLEAARLYPTPSGMAHKDKKRQYDRRTRWLRERGHKGPGLRPGQVVFGRKVEA